MGRVETRRRLPRSLVALALVVPAILAALLAAPTGTGATLVVGYDDTLPLASLSAAGARLVSADPALGLAFAVASDPEAALASLSRASDVTFAERDGVVVAQSVAEDSSRWDSSRWDSSRWDSSRWDALLVESSRWDSSRWDSSRWDSSRWDSSRWDSSRWDSSRWDSSRWDSSRWDGTYTQDPLLQYQWGLADLRVDDAWAQFPGGGSKTICVLDSGVDFSHPDLARNLWRGSQGERGYDFVNSDADPSDDAGHGTHVAGVAAARIGNGLGVAGVVDAKIIAVKVLDAEGFGTDAALAQGIRWCTDHGANVLLMALSGEERAKAVERAVAYAREKGALLVASAGSHGRYPAAYDGVLAVAPLTLGAEPAAFAIGGDHVDLAGPGDRIAGPIPGASYALGSGASQAAALIAGGAALVWEANPSLDAGEVAKILEKSARDVGKRGNDDLTGKGEPDLGVAVGLALKAKK